MRPSQKPEPAPINLETFTESERARAALGAEIKLAGGLDIVPLNPDGTTGDPIDLPSVPWEVFEQKCKDLETSGKGSCSGIDFEVEPAEEPPFIYDNQLVG